MKIKYLLLAAFLIILFNISCATKAKYITKADMLDLNKCYIFGRFQ